jgi:hypothetical protein
VPRVAAPDVAQDVAQEQLDAPAPLAVAPALQDVAPLPAGSPPDVDSALAVLRAD